MKKHFANIITVSRIIGAFYIFTVTPYSDIRGKYHSLIVFLILAITDKLDGTIAKSKFGQITPLGKILDPMADKLLALIYLALIEMHQITTVPVALLLGRDIIVSTARQHAISQGIDVAAKLSGKIKTAFAFSLAFILLARSPVEHVASDDILHQVNMLILEKIVLYINAIPAWIIQYAIFTLVFLSVYSCIDYCLRFYRNTNRFHIKQE